MSHSFYVATPEAVVYDEVMREIGTPDVEISEDVEPGDGPWPQGTIHLFIDNVSTRPLEVIYEGGNFQIRIFSCSSLEDYKFALKLVRTVAGKSGAPIEPEDNDAMDIETFERQYNEKWATEHCHQMVDMAIGLFQKNKSSLSMVGTRAELQAGKRFISQVLEDPENRHDRFLERFRRLNYVDQEDVFIASKIIMSNSEDTRKLSMVVFGEDIETLLPADADAVAVRSNGGEIAEIGFDRFVEIVSARGVWLSEDSLFVPAHSGEEFSELFRAAKASHLEDVFALGTDITEDERAEMQKQKDAQSSPLGNLSEDEIRKMTYAPFTVFLMISAADGDIDQKELNAFVEALREQETEPLGEVLRFVPKSPQEMISEISGDVEAALTNLREIVELADEKLPPPYAIKLKVGLWEIANKVATASGGLLGLGDRVSKEEKAALNALALILRPD